MKTTQADMSASTLNALTADGGGIDADAAADAAAEAEAARVASPYLYILDSIHTTWMTTYDACDPDTAPLSVLLELLQTAPTDFGRGMAFAALTARARERAEAYAELHQLRAKMASSQYGSVRLPVTRVA